MCTIVVLRRPDHEWPLILAANRDEMRDRPADPPGRHWPDRPDVLAGRDRLAEGSWLGINDAGLVAGILNRPGTLGPAEGKRSRGELVLEALDHVDATDAAAALADLAAESYRPFNLLLADNRDAFWLRNDGARIDRFPIPEGVSMLTAHDRNDPRSPRVFRHLADFEAAAAPDPASADWAAWIEILARRALHDPEDGMTIVTERGFGTVSSALIALPAMGVEDRKPIFLHAEGRPGETEYLAAGGVS